MTEKNKLQMGVEVNMTKKTSAKKSAKTRTDDSAKSATDPHSPFCIAVLGDFSGRNSRAQHQPETMASRRFIEVDRDNFEDVMASLKIKVTLNLQTDERIQFDIKELDDFHPDELYEKLDAFARLRSLRRRLKSKKTFAEAAAEMQSWLPVDSLSDTGKVKIPTPVTPDTDAAIQAVLQSSDNLLDSIIDSHQQQSTDVASVEAGQIDNLIKSIVAPYIEAAADPRQDEMLSTLDRATAGYMQHILHNAEFQAMESAWQSVYFLIKRLETGNKLKIVLLDVSKEELQADLGAEDISTSAMYKMFCDSSEGDRQWSLLLGNYTFNDSIADVLSLASLAEIAQRAGAPFIAAANEKIASCEAFATTADYEDWNYPVSDGVKKAWLMLRQSPAAAYIGLVLPRFLLRLPYGKKTKPIESFAFEEMPEQHCHNCYLWGNAAFIKAELLARNFLQNGWSMQPEKVFQTDNLPVHYYHYEGETVSKPVAEITLSEKAAEILTQQGLMPLWSVKNMDAIRSADFRSLEINGKKIMGRWGVIDQGY